MRRTCALFSSFLQRTRNVETAWRRGGDSNPRDPFESTRVPGVRLKPGSATSPRANAIMHHKNPRGHMRASAALDRTCPRRLKKSSGASRINGSLRRKGLQNAAYADLRLFRNQVSDSA